MVDVTELARTALLEVTSEDTVGQPVGTVDEGDGVVSVLFSNRMPGYPGWRWTVSVAHVEGDEPTVLEVELMPGEGSLVAPEWVPWSERMAEYRASQDESDTDDESDDEDDDEDPDEDADYEDPDDDEADDDESDDDDEFGDDEDDLDESDDDELDGVDVDRAAEVVAVGHVTDAGAADDDQDDDAEPAPRSRGARRRARRVRPTEPDDDLELDRLDAGETDPDRHRG